MHEEIGTQNIGTAEILPNNPIVVNSKGTWKIKFIVGSVGLKINGAVKITIPHGFSLPQDKAFFDPGFVRIESHQEIEFSIKIVSDIFCRLDKDSGHSGAWGRNVFISPKTRDMVEGESFTLIYGDTTYYGKESFSKTGAYARELSGKAEFIVSIDPDGSRFAKFSGFYRLPKIPSIDLLPGSPIKSRFIIRSSFNSNNSCNAELKEGLWISLDRFNNPESWEIMTYTNPYLKNHRFPLYNDLKKSELLSNPSVDIDTLGGYYLYWGDIHGHTIHSDGLGTIDEYYRFAKEVAFLDFSSITDHDDIGPHLTDEEWKMMEEGAEKYNETNKFITLLGHEYRNGKCDMNIYYPGDSGHLICGKCEEYTQIKQVVEKIKPLKAMIIPHMHFGADWSGFDPDLYRVMEIYSSHGCAEHKGCQRGIPYLRTQVQKSSDSNENTYFHDMLNLGYKLGVTAGSDTHSGRPGLSDWTRVCRTYLGGLTAVFAKEQTREAVWDALYNQRCYATTGNRSILKFTINGHIMGSEISLGSITELDLDIKCLGDGILRSIIIYKSGSVFFHQDLNERDFEVYLKDTSTQKNSWYYVRFDLEDGEMVWSSPIWINE